jgi:hypothetical protein
MRRKEELRRIGAWMFIRLEDAFPALSMRIEPGESDVLIRLSIPAQPGLAFPIELRVLEDDELEIHAGAIELGYVPCTEPDFRERWFEWVSALLAGTLRIRETQRGGKTFQSELQRPTADGWETILATCSSMPPRGRKRVRILRNRP